MRSLTIRGRDPARAVTFAPATLLAPMDGYTDRVFRDLVLDQGSVGGGLTEFIRISVDPVPKKVFRRELGDVPRRDVPVGAQLMAADAEFVAETVGNADACCAAWIDLNFGCPVKRVFNKCAGSALLAFPERMGEIVAAAVRATDLPVTAKIRAGVDDASRLDDVLDACAEAGAAAVTLHARLRRNSYADPARWEWIAHAAQRLHARPEPVPLIGNGGADVAADFQRMLEQTGCDAVMVGRGALANPWVFREAVGGAAASRDEAIAFARGYFEMLLPPGSPPGPIARFKAFIATFRAAGFWDGRDDVRRMLLREPDPERIRAWFDAEAGAPR
ncbi:MAG: tRNA-dihydrouridine synthase family protein [Planctomycetes bacterium]|nr:tRNA-dihydrouridine synthase family protein [Planctomycetota bacterium]